MGYLTTALGVQGNFDNFQIKKFNNSGLVSLTDSLTCWVTKPFICPPADEHEHEHEFLDEYKIYVKDEQDDKDIENYGSKDKETICSPT